MIYSSEHSAEIRMPRCFKTTTFTDEQITSILFACSPHDSMKCSLFLSSTNRRLPMTSTEIEIGSKSISDADSSIASFISLRQFLPLHDSGSFFLHSIRITIDKPRITKKLIMKHLQIHGGILI